MLAERGPTTYRVDRAVVLRVVGPVVVAIGLSWVVVGLTGGRAVRGVLVLLTLGLVAAAVVAATRPPRVLTLTARGFRVSLVRGAGTTSGDWSEVDSVDTSVASGAPSLVIRLSDGRSSVIPLLLLGARTLEARREIHERLNTAHGYRHLDAS